MLQCPVGCEMNHLVELENDLKLDPINRGTVSLQWWRKPSHKQRLTCNRTVNKYKTLVSICSISKYTMRNSLEQGTSLQTGNQYLSLVRLYAILHSFTYTQKLK